MKEHIGCSRRRSALGLATVAVLLGAAVTGCGNGSDSGAAAKVVDQYLTAVASGDADELAHLPEIFPDDTAIDLDRAARLLSADTTTRIDHVTLGDPEQSRTISDATGYDGSDLSFDEFETFPVTFSLNGRTFHNQVVVGLTTEDPRWLVVTPLDVDTPWSQIDLSGPGGVPVATSSAQVRVGGVDLGRLAHLAQNDFLLHPAHYELSVDAGRYLIAEPVGLTVAAVDDPTSTHVKLSLSRAGVDRLESNAIAAFSRCTHGTAYCPVRELVIPHLAGPPTENPTGWWSGLTKKPRMHVVGDTLRLRGGEFRYDTDHGVRTIRFEGTAPIVFGGFKTSTAAIGPGHREPNVGPFFHVRRTR